MSKRIREHLRSNVVGYVAIFLFAIAGTAYAANTIGSADIINGQVKSADIGNNQVQSADVRDDTLPNGGLTGADVRENTLSVPTAGIANHAVTAGKLATAPAASVLKLSPETTHSAAGTILHADFELYDTANLHDNSTDTREPRRARRRDLLRLGDRRLGPQRHRLPPRVAPRRATIPSPRSRARRSPAPPSPPRTSPASRGWRRARRFRCRPCRAAAPTWGPGFPASRWR